MVRRRIQIAVACFGILLAAALGVAGMWYFMDKKISEEPGDKVPEEKTLRADPEKEEIFPEPEKEEVQPMEDPEPEKVLTEEELQALVAQKAEEQLTQKVEEKIASMTPEEKVAQLFIITPEALTGYDTVIAAGEATRSSLQRYPVGGLVFFSQNLTGEDQLKEMTGNLQYFADEIEGMPLFLCIDEEGGTVARIGNNGNFQVSQIPDMADIGATEDVEEARQVGREIGGYLSEYGFNLDFAPVADVLTNSQNTVVRSRSLGSDPQLVSSMCLAIEEELEYQGVLGCLKHFPGHGATAGDTHDGYAYTDKSLEEMRQAELVPFAQAAQEGVPFIMVSHISAPSVTGDDLPSTLSYTMLTEILRGDLGYEGIIVTDAMNMGAIVNQYSSGEAAVKALEAGVDMILMPADFYSAYQGVLDAYEDGRISEERLDQSLRRIIRQKYKIVS